MKKHPLLLGVGLILGMSFQADAHCPNLPVAWFDPGGHPAPAALYQGHRANMQSRCRLFFSRRVAIPVCRSHEKARFQTCLSRYFLLARDDAAPLGRKITSAASYFAPFYNNDTERAGMLALFDRLQSGDTATT
jgi:hypothetical protein